MRKYTITITVYVFLILGSVLGLSGSGLAAEGSRSATFFSRGEAPYDPQDQAKSQQAAVQDFMAQGLTQAVSSFLSPAQMGTQFSEIQKSLLAKPSKYIDSYQVFSESQADGMFRVIGQVTVSMDMLRKDLEQSGILSAQQKARAEPEPSRAMNAPASAPEGEETQGEGVREPSAEAKDSHPAASQPQAAGEAGKPSFRGITATKGEILWVVSEKWEQEWELPTEGAGDRFLFARSLGKEMDGYDFAIHLPLAGSVRMDLSGSVPSSQVISLAEGLGIQDVVVGRVSYAQDRNSKQVWLDASLRVIRIGQGKSEFELHKAQSMDDLSNQEGALELARLVAPQLSSLLGGSQAAHAAGGAGQGASSAQAGSVGPLTIYLPSTQFSYWSEFESMLREQWKNMQVNGLEIGPAEGVVKLNGVSGDSILKMSGASLPSGATLRVDSYSTEAQTMKISFAPPGKAQAETK